MKKQHTGRRPALTHQRLRYPKPTVAHPAEKLAVERPGSRELLTAAGEFEGWEPQATEGPCQSPPVCASGDCLLVPCGCRGSSPRSCHGSGRD